ncbi:MAG: adenylate/guanylate cyclase domain-containing protein [Proteobacteria bacterium]|nr:adenylate/guanylate cyclase domain-containing protein [Pseudomonadota bacterium]MBU1455611.1 adenylate/guanylate cyclase domain-containing protein [Pseudomonadota bacterium]
MRTRKQELSFYRRIRISLGLMGILPFLLAMYLVLQEVGAPSQTMIVSAALVLFSILMGFVLLRKSSDQLACLARETSMPGPGDVPLPLNVKVDGELKDIATNFNAVVAQLNKANRDIQSRSFQLQEFARNLSDSYEQLESENRLRTHLCRYVGKDLVEKLMVSKDGKLLKDERKIVTVMFADIRSFTAISEQIEPEEVLAMLNEYFTVMVDIVFKYNGMLDKLVGDQIMAVFGHMSSEREGARAAVRAAFEMQNAAAVLMRKRAKDGLPVFKIGIGINTGSAILGSVGAENRKDYTVIGDTVNAAARLEKHAGEREVVIGERTCKHIPPSIYTGNRQELRMKNRMEPVVCYTLTPTKKRVAKTVTPAARTMRIHPAFQGDVAC